MHKNKKLLKDFLGQRLRRQYEYISSNSEATCHEFQKGDNKQGHDHCLAVEKNLDLLIPDTEKQNGLNETEILVLLASAHLHDIGKIEGPCIMGWKSEHGQRGMGIINDQYDRLGLDRIQAAAVATIVGVHGTGRLDQLPSEPLLVGTDQVHLIKLAAIFRLADMLDTTYQRAPEIVSKILFPDENIPEKWQARQSISGWTLDESDRIVLQALPSAEEISAAYTLRDMLNEDLALIAPHLRMAGYPWELAELDVSQVPLSSKLSKPAYKDRAFPGMAYYEEEQANIFKGRDAETKKLLSVISNSPITLLIGESGAGKTSLIHAGLFPNLRAMNWECVWTRPLGDPRTSIRDLIWRALLSGPIKGSLGLWEVMKLAAEKYRPRKLLIAFDQFEDILNCPQSIIDGMAQDLTTVQARYVMPNLRVLISFREDSFVRLSTRLLKPITGSAKQFPSVEIERLSRDGARQAFISGLENARIGLDPHQDMGQKPLLETILDDIQQTEDRIYPPYLQMVAETLCSLSGNSDPIISREKYYECGTAKNIIGHYLIRRLDEFGNQKEHARDILLALTSSAGTKVQKKISELSQITCIELEVLESILIKMIDLRMARRIDLDKYEIIHDHLSFLVDKELLLQEDRELKFLREQLEAAQRLYDVHKEPIRSTTIWISLYRHRKKIELRKEMQPLFVCSYLINEASSQYEDVILDQSLYGLGIGSLYYFSMDSRCGWFWLRNIKHQDLILIVRDLIRHGEKKVSLPASKMLVDLISSNDKEFVISMLTDQNKDIRRTALNIISKKGINSEIEMIAKMIKADENVRDAAAEAFKKVCSNKDLFLIADLLNDGNETVRFFAVSILNKYINYSELKLLFHMHNRAHIPFSWFIEKKFSEVVSREDLIEISESLKSDKKEYQREAEQNFVRLLENHLSFVALLGDKDEKIRELALFTLSDFENSSTKKYLSYVYKLLNDDYEGVRFAASQAFANLVTKEDLFFIKTMLSSNDKNLQLAAISALGRLGMRDELSNFSESLNYETDLGYQALEELSSLLTRNDLELISRMLKNEKRSVRASALSAFDSIGTADDCDLITPMLKDEFYAVRQKALELIKELGCPDHLPILFDMMVDPVESVSELAVEAIAQLMSAEDAETIIDAIADKAKGSDKFAASNYKLLCLLDRKIYFNI